jgi:hypothetical protein
MCQLKQRSTEHSVVKIAEAKARQWRKATINNSLTPLTSLTPKKVRYFLLFYLYSKNILWQIRKYIKLMSTQKTKLRM